MGVGGGPLSTLLHLFAKQKGKKNGIKWETERALPITTMDVLDVGHQLGGETHQDEGGIVGWRNGE